MTKSTLQILEEKWANAVLDEDNSEYQGSFELWGELVRYESEPLPDGSFWMGEATTFRHADSGCAFTIMTDYEGEMITDADDLVIFNVWHWLHKIDIYYRETTGGANWQLDLVWQMVSEEMPMLMSKYESIQKWHG
jgi:hypothetical protein